MSSGDILTYDDILFKKSPTELGVDAPSPNLSEEVSNEIKKGRLPTFGDIKTLFSPLAKVINRSGVKDNQLVTNDDFIFEKEIIIDWKSKYPWLHFGPIPNTNLYNNVLDKIYLTCNPQNIVYSSTLIPIKDKIEFLDNPTTIIQNVTIGDGDGVVFSLQTPFNLLLSGKSVNKDNIALWINISQIKSFKNEGGSHTVLKDIYNNYYTLDNYFVNTMQWFLNSYSTIIDDDDFIKMNYSDFMEGTILRGYWKGSSSLLNEGVELGMAQYYGYHTTQNLGVGISLTQNRIPIRNIMFRIRFTKGQANDSSDGLSGEYGFVLQLVKQIS